MVSDLNCSDTLLSQLASQWQRAMYLKRMNTILNFKTLSYSNMLRDFLESYIPTSSTSLFRQHNLNYVFVPWNFQIFNAAINIIDNLSTPIAYLLTRILLACWSFLSAKKSLFQKKNWKLFLFFLPSSICNRTSFIISRIAIIGNDFPMLGRIWYWLVDSSFTFFCDDVFSFDWMVDCVWDMISLCI